MSRRLVLIGIGAGDPDWLTLAAVRAIQAIDVLYIVVKENDYDDLVTIRRELLRRHRSRALRIVELADPPRPWRSTPDYPAAVATWRAQRAEQWGAAVTESLADGELGGFLCWGDPSLYESTLAIVDQLLSADPGLSREVVPGVSSVHALTAAHQIPLNRQGRAVQILPARLIRDGLSPEIDDAVVMLDGQQTFAQIDPTGLDIYWGAYLGTPQQILIAGALADVRDDICRVRTEAAQTNGWVFDTYLLRRR